MHADCSVFSGLCGGLVSLHGQCSGPCPVGRNDDACRNSGRVFCLSSCFSCGFCAGAKMPSQKSNSPACQPDPCHGCGGMAPLCGSCHAAPSSCRKNS
ncbi:MAG TPA: hypothetical protein DCW68_06245 [Rhodospirillaceae bacterium]|nr:hypothetical protein [Rhodospirillaceae bacterium]